jgi:hypothetical protein
MSHSTSGVFTPVLKEVGQGLSLPIPRQVRILRELRADLEELTERLVEEGLTPEEARGEAQVALVPDARTLAALERLHSPLYRRLTWRMDSGKLRAVERSALVLSAGSVLLVQTLTLLRANLLRDPSPFLIPVLLGGALLFALAFAKAFQLWIKKDHVHPARGLNAILGVAGLVIGLGIGGLIFDLYRLAGLLESSPELAGSLVADWLVRDSALLSVAIILAMAGGLAWFILSQWVTLVTGARWELTGLNPSIQSKGEQYDAQ